MHADVDILGALSRPLRALVDPQERIFWGFLLSSLAMPWLVLGLRRGTAALREGLGRRALWGSASSRADVTLMFVKAAFGAVARLPWAAATAGASLWIALSLQAGLGPAATPDWSRPTIAVVYSVVLFVGWDLSRFVLHLGMHRVRALWAFHQVHHSARVLTPLTLYRTHPVETLLYDLRGLVTTASITGVFLYWFSGRAEPIELLGINALGFGFNLAGANLRHSHVWLRFGRLERWVLSPAQHQLHHARQLGEHSRNLGTWLAVWDRLAGTWRAAPRRAPRDYGLHEANHRFDRVGSMLLGPLVDVATRGGRVARPAGALVGVLLLPRTAVAGAVEPGAVERDGAVEPGGTVEPGGAESGAAERSPGQGGAPEGPASPGASRSEGDADAVDGEPREPSGADEPAVVEGADEPTVVEGADEPTEAEGAGEPTEAEGAGELGEPRPGPENPVGDGSGTEGSGPTPEPGGDPVIEPEGVPVAEPSPTPAAPSPTPNAPAGAAPGATGEDASPVSEPDPSEESEARTIVVGSMLSGGPRVVGSAHAISERELERHEYDDIHKILAGEVPGVYVRGEDGFGLRPNIGLRGANPDRSAKITLLEDGVLLGPAPYSAPAAYYFPLTTRMVGMEVFKGPAAIQHGPNTIGGAINLVTRDIPEDHAGEVDLAGGRFGYAKGHAYYGTTYRGFGVLVEAARVQTTGFKELDGGGDTGFAKNDAMLKLGYRTPAGRRVSHEVQLKAGVATEDSNETYLGLSRADFEATPYRRYAASARDNMSWWRTQAELTYALRQEDTVEFEARLYRHDFDRVWSRLDSFRDGPALSDILADPDGGQAAVFSSILRGVQDSLLPQQALLLTNNDRSFVSQGLQSVFRWRPQWERVDNVLEVGARVHGDSIERNHSEDAFLMTSGTMVPEGTDRVDTVINRGSTVAAAFHVQDALSLWKERLTVAPGVRVEVISMRFEDTLADERSRRLDAVVSPGVGVHGAVTPWLGLFGGVHRGFSPVSPGQLNAIEPEFSLNYELGARAAWRGLRAEAVGFVSDYRNLLGACTFSAGCVEGDGREQFNAGGVLVYGAETMARYRHRFDNGFGVEVGAHYTYTGSRFESAFQSSFSQWGAVEAGDELPYVPKHVAGGTVGVGGRIWDVHVSPSYSGQMRDVAGQGPIAPEERIDRFFLLDVGAEVRVLQRFRIYGQVGNATNNAYVSSYRPFGIRPGAPLTFMLGVKAALFP